MEASRIANRAAEIPPFIVMDVLEKAQEMERGGADIVHLEVGEPDLDTPECIKEACLRALRDGKTHYTHSLGLIELREAVCEHYHRRYGVTVGPDQVLITSGTSPAMQLLFAAILEPGDEVIISDPHYACYPNFIRFFDGVPVDVPVHEAEGFQYTTPAIREKITPRTGRSSSTPPPTRRGTSSTPGGWPRSPPWACRSFPTRSTMASSTGSGSTASWNSRTTPSS